jgi:mRNA-degrading endonuclease toxin of MazEF toxin-antitoxin module
VLLEPGEDPVPQTSVVNLDSVERVPLGTLVERLGRLSDERMRQIALPWRSPSPVKPDSAFAEHRAPDLRDRQ